MENILDKNISIILLDMFYYVSPYHSKGNKILQQMHENQINTCDSNVYPECIKSIIHGYI